MQDLDVDYDKGIINIKYDVTKTNAQQVYKWLQVIVDIGIDYYDELKVIWEKDEDEDQKVEEIWQRMRTVLTKALAKI